MEKSIVLLAGLLLSFSAVAQTKVVKANAVKANDYTGCRCRSNQGDL